MITPFLFLLLGYLLIFLEFFLPGAVMGIAGGAFLFLSIILFAMRTESVLLLLLFLAIALAGLVFLIRFALQRIRARKADMYQEDDQEGFKAAVFDEALLGKGGVVVADLKPSGFIKVEGRTYQALAQAGYLNKGEEIEIIAGRGAYYIVKQRTKD